MAEQLDSGNFYEYSQFIKTIFFKYKMRRRFKEMKELIEKAINDLGAKKEAELVVDIFEIYFKEHVLKMRGSEDDIKLVEDEYLFKMCTLVHTHGNQQRVVSILVQVAQTCVSNEFVPFNQKICKIVADIYDT
jgi:hypothetical protein